MATVRPTADRPMSAHARGDGAGPEGKERPPGVHAGLWMGPLPACRARASRRVRALRRALNLSSACQPSRKARAWASAVMWRRALICPPTRVAATALAAHADAAIREGRLCLGFQKISAYRRPQFGHAMPLRSA